MKYTGQLEKPIWKNSSISSTRRPSVMDFRTICSPITGISWKRSKRIMPVASSSRKKTISFMQRVFSPIGDEWESTITALLRAIRKSAVIWEPTFSSGKQSAKHDAERVPPMIFSESHQTESESSPESRNSSSDSIQRKKLGQRKKCLSINPFF